MARRQEIRTFFIVTVIACVPVVGSIWAVNATLEPDLSDLAPLTAQMGQYSLLEWSSLLGRHTTSPNVKDGVAAGPSVRALGYMMDGPWPMRSGAPTSRFLLLPDAGNLLHPAHRFGDQMIAVELRNGDTTTFGPRALVWVWGTLRTSAGDPTGNAPLYLLANARVELAVKGDIRKYFRFK